MLNRITLNTVITQKIIIPENVSIEKINNHYTFNGLQGKITYLLNSDITTHISHDYITIEVNITKKDKKHKKIALLNTITAIFKNFIKGVMELFEKTIIIKGIGYKVEYVNNKSLKLFLGYSHPIIYTVPNDIIIDLINPTSICIKGISKHKVGQIAHEIKMKKPADIYKGNGIKYKDEILRLKSAKKTK